MDTRPCTLPTILERVDHPDLPWALECVFHTFNRLVEIDPEQSWRDILRDASRVITEFLGARAASIRLHEPHLDQMVSFGSFHMDEAERETAIPYDESIAGRVVSTQSGCVVPDIATAEDYHNKGVVERGLRSLMAVPLLIPRFSEATPDIRGAIQVYFGEAPRSFSRVEVLTAELMAQRVSYVIARKRILDLRRVNEKKEWLVEKIFAKLSIERGIKMKDLFRLMVEELQDIISVQSCSLFAVSDDGATAVLESGWPEQGSYHTVGREFRVAEHPYLLAAVRRDHPLGDFRHERVYPSYLLVKDPQESCLVTEALRTFCRTHGIHSILYVPLQIADRVRYVLVFDAVDRRRFFSDEEIEILTFFGMQLTQALEIERLDEILHDFKNPAIAVAGFTRRVRRMVEPAFGPDSEVLQHLDVIVHEATRLQEMAMSVYPLARPEVLDLAEVARARVRINDEAVREQQRTGIETVADGLAPGVRVVARRLALERVVDNLLNNATKAIPPGGGALRVRVFVEGDRGILEISNTGCITPDVIKKIRASQMTGRGLNIVYRLVRSMGGEVKVGVDAGCETTTFRVALPLCPGEPADSG